MLKRSRPVMCLVLALFVVGVDAADETKSSSLSPADISAIEKEVRAGADSFVASFANRDAAAIAACWTEDGVYINEEGRRFQGRPSIQSEYETLFKNSSDDLNLRLEIDSIRLLNSQTAIEEGRAALTPQPPGAVRVMSRYTAVHVKQDGRWLLADVRDTRVELSPDAGQLEDLEWLVGTWTATNKDARVDVKFRWIENQHFLARSHATTEAGKATSGGLEIVGRDPLTGQITSWSFTNDGGHAVAIWAPHDDGWAIDSIGVIKDGTQTTATNILSRKDGDTLVWKSVNRSVGDTLVPDTEEVDLKRQ